MNSILISACLLGVPCRYDGAEKANPAALRLAETFHLIPVCPEQMGGLATPRLPAEICGEAVVTCNGGDVTHAYRRGAEAALRLARLFHCETAVLKERSPSCGSGEVHDGAFSGGLTEGDGVTAALLKANGIRVLGESQIEKELLQDNQKP